MLSNLEVKPVSSFSERFPHPFVKWAGGKRQLIDELTVRCPVKFSVYREPFLGGGALFFHLARTRKRFRAVLSDANEELICAYQEVRDHVDDVLSLLRQHELRYREKPREYYYEIRGFSRFSSAAERAARLIFLNKTCYNGLYRVNHAGQFNVPFGRYSNPQICDEANLRAVSEALRLTDAELFVADFECAVKTADKGDFVYFDPPYQPVSKTANFTGYTVSCFHGNEQRRLASLFRFLDSRGCRLLLSNSDHPTVIELYQGYRIERVYTVRAINCKSAKRAGHSELIISNY